MSILFSDEKLIDKNDQLNKVNYRIIAVSNKAANLVNSMLKRFKIHLKSWYELVSQIKQLNLPIMFYTANSSFFHIQYRNFHQLTYYNLF